MKDYDSATEWYRKTVAMSPRGYFTAITALDTLERESNGELPRGTYLGYVSLEWMEGSQRATVVRALTKNLPQFAPGWKELAHLTNDGTERWTAIETGLGAKPDAETKGILLVNKALMLQDRGNHAAAVQILGQLAIDPESPFDTEQIAKFTLAKLPGRNETAR